MGTKVIPGMWDKVFVYGRDAGEKESRQAKNSEGVNLGTGAMKSARELISGIAIKRLDYRDLSERG